jgi:DNA-binding transcriptional LysR family regulator
MGSSFGKIKTETGKPPFQAQYPLGIKLIQLNVYNVSLNLRLSMKNLRSNISLDALLCFHQIATLQSLVRAAKVLAVSPPAVTHTLHRLESSLGVKLCLRGRKGFRLTEEGKALFERTKVIVAQLDGYVDFLRNPNEFTGLLSLGLADNFENAHLQNALNKTVERFPKMRLSITIASSEELTRLVSVGEVDAAFSIFFAKSDRLSYFEIGQSTTHYFVSKRHPLAGKRKWKREDLFGENLMWVDDKWRSRQELEAGIFVDHPRMKMKVRAYTNQLEGALPVLRSGFAVVPAAPRYIERLRDSRDFVEIKADTKKPVYREECLFNPSATLSVAARFLIDEVKALAR